MAKCNKCGKKLNRDERKYKIKTGRKIYRLCYNCERIINDLLEKEMI